MMMAFLLSACSKYSYYAVGSSNAVTRYSDFAWLPPINNAKASYLDNDVAEQKIKDRATSGLESKGLHLNAKTPDLLARYTLMVDRKVAAYNQGVYNYAYFNNRGYYMANQPFDYDYSGVYPVYVGEEIYRVPYKQGTLIIDLIDKNTHKVIWRGYGIGEVDNPQSAVNNLPKVVDGILNKLQLNK